MPEQANTAGEICVFRPTLAPTPAVALAHVMQATQGMTEMVTSILEHSRLVFDDLNARTRAALQGLPDELPAVVQGFSIYRARSGIPRTMASRATRWMALDAKRAMFTEPAQDAPVLVIRGEEWAFLVAGLVVQGIHGHSWLVLLPILLIAALLWGLLESTWWTRDLCMVICTGGLLRLSLGSKKRKHLIKRNLYRL